MAYRLVGLAGAQIDQILLESARRWGEERAIRHYYLILAAISAIAEEPERPGSRPIRGGAGLRVFSLRLARDGAAGASRWSAETFHHLSRGNRWDGRGYRDRT
jgi:hypothetical protein